MIPNVLHRILARHVSWWSWKHGIPSSNRPRHGRIPGTKAKVDPNTISIAMAGLRWSHDQRQNVARHESSADPSSSNFKIFHWFFSSCPPSIGFSNVNIHNFQLSFSTGESSFPSFFFHHVPPYSPFHWVLQWSPSMEVIQFHFSIHVPFPVDTLW